MPLNDLTSLTVAPPNRPHWSTQCGEHNTLAGLPALAADIRKHLDDTDLTGPAAMRQVLCVAEEAGEFAGAYRRYAGAARRQGSYQEMADEAADVAITIFVACEYLGIDLAQAIRDKTEKIYSRGWQEGPRFNGLDPRADLRSYDKDTHS